MMDYFETPEEALEHFGVKGMKWGVRKDRDSGGSSGPTKKEAKQSVRGVAKDAGAAIKAHRTASKAGDKAGMKQARQDYREVLKQVKSKEFKANYTKANSFGKGEMVVHALAFGPFAAVTIPVAKASSEARIKAGYELELAVGKEILDEMKSR